MNAKIAVIGMGQGGMTAAVKLAEAGASVTVFERRESGQAGYPWRDDIRLDIFEKVGLPPLPEDAYVQKPNWIFVPPSWQGSLAVPVLKPLEEVSVDRRKLTRYFVDLAQKAGAKCEFGATVSDLLVDKERVVGVVVNGRPLSFDLVIDASGVCSPFRGQVPARFGVQAKAALCDLLWGHRAFFEVPRGAKTMDENVRCTMSVRPLGWEGIAWCNLSPENECDVLIAKMERLSAADIAAMKEEFKSRHAILGDKELHSQTVPICLRKGIARPVADGYVALGDSAFMTIPVMGSGIEASMTGGQIFADYVVANRVERFDAAAMWGFYVQYMHELGKGFALMDAVRRCALRWPTKVFDWALSGKFLRYDELAYVMLEKGFGKPKMPLGAYCKTLCMLLFKPSVACKLFAALGHGLKAMSIAGKMPKTYDEKRLSKWQKRYDGHLDTLDRVTAKYDKRGRK